MTASFYVMRKTHAPIWVRVGGRSPFFRTFVLLVVLICDVPVGLAQDPPTVQVARAAMLFNFLKFTEFPRESIANSEFIQVCVGVRDARQRTAMAALSGRKAGGRELVVTDFSAQRRDCDVLYLDSPQRWNAVATNPLLRQALTISAYPGFARDGGMIEIAVQNEGIRFDINLAQSRRAGFRFSPQLLRLARKIHE